MATTRVIPGHEDCDLLFTKFAIIKSCKIMNATKDIVVGRDDVW